MMYILVWKIFVRLMIKTAYMYYTYMCIHIYIHIHTQAMSPLNDYSVCVSRLVHGNHCLLRF